MVDQAVQDFQVHQAGKETKVIQVVVVIRRLFFQAQKAPKDSKGNQGHQVGFDWLGINIINNRDNKFGQSQF